MSEDAQKTFDEIVSDDQHTLDYMSSQIDKELAKQSDPIRRELWKEIYVAGVRDGVIAKTILKGCDFAVKEYDKRFTS